MRQRQEYKGSTETVGDAESEVCLFEDYAVKDRRSFILGQVIRIKHNGKDFRRPVSFHDDKRKDMEVTFQLYNMSDKGQGNYLKGTNIVVKTIDDILTHVNLVIDEDGDGLILDTVQQETIQSLQQPPQQPRRSQRKDIDSTQKNTRSTNQNESDDGRCVLLVQPTTSSASEDPNVRRSKRTRKAIFHVYQ